MKKIILILIFMSALLAKGQDYIPLLGDNKVWSVSHEKFTFSGDTIINELEYAKLFYHNFLQDFTPDSLEYVAALREDTINKKVYFIWKDYETEVLLYDFSLDVGDTVTIKSPDYYLDSPSFSDNYFRIGMKILERKDTIIDGKNRSILKLIGIYGGGGLEYWIEGIGSTVGLIYAGSSPHFPLDVEYPELLCLHRNNHLIYKALEDLSGNPLDTCYILPLGGNIDEFKRNSFNVTIIPSIFKEKLDIVCELPVCKITIYNQTGTIVYQNNTSYSYSKLTISTDQWKSGLYIIRAGNAKHFVSKKIVKL